MYKSFQLSGEAFSEIKDRTEIVKYNVRLTMTFPEEEGTEKKEVNYYYLFIIIFLKIFIISDATLCRERSPVCRRGEVHDESNDGNY